MSLADAKPDVAAYLTALAASPRPPFTAEVLAMIRQLPPAMMAAQDLPAGNLARMEDLSCPGPAGPVRLRLFDPRAGREPGPLILFFHGGGFALGSIDTHASLSASIARALDCPLVSVEYRLAPEHPFPAAPDDAEAVARWLATDGPTALGVGITGIILCGDSAGGNLAVVTALALRDRPAALPVVAQLLFYPGLDRSRRYPSAQAYGAGFALDDAQMALFDEHYAADPADPRCSPLLADLAGLPPAAIITAGLDPLRDEGRAYAAALAGHGIPLLFAEVPGTIHGFASYRAVIPSAAQDLDAALRLARGFLDDPRAAPR